MPVDEHLPPANGDPSGNRVDDDFRRAQRSRRTLAVAVGVTAVIAVALIAAVVAVATSGDGAPPAALEVVSAEPSPAAETSTTTTTPVATTTPPPTTAAAATTAAPQRSGSTEYVYPLVPASAGKYAHSHHDYPASDMFAPCATPFVSPVAGVVQDVSRTDEWSSKKDDPALRGGLSVSVAGDDGVRYYGSHLASVDPGANPGVRVEAGTPLGKVGDSGNAKGSGCHLHFGISPATGAGDWKVRRGVVYPWPYLDSWRDGGQKSPVAEVKASR